MSLFPRQPPQQLPAAAAGPRQVAGCPFLLIAHLMGHDITLGEGVSFALPHHSLRDGGRCLLRMQLRGEQHVTGSSPGSQAFPCCHTALCFTPHGPA
jgi:hypothetical protein